MLRLEAPHLTPLAGSRVPSFSIEPPYVIANLDEDFEDTNLGGDVDFHCLILHAQSVILEGSLSDTFREGLLP